MICPVCNNDSLEEGETVDVGFGSHCGPKVSPDWCEICGYVERGFDGKPNLSSSIEHYIDCWERQIEPYVPMPYMNKFDDLPTPYQEWIKKNVPEWCLGMCAEKSREMQKLFPELRRVAGYYYDLSWGERGHFWLVDPQFRVVDPTSNQFPTKGRGVYHAVRFED